MPSMNDFITLNYYSGKLTKLILGVAENNNKNT